ncbi:SATB1_N and homeodomain domain-containing protein dve [Cochliomyia hominivorax]
MDFQSAMETFAEAWVAANAGQQSQALALTRVANAAAAAAAANAKSPTVDNLHPDVVVKREQSLTPPPPPTSVSNLSSLPPPISTHSSIPTSSLSTHHSPTSISSNTNAQNSATNADECQSNSSLQLNRRPSLQGVQDKLAQLQQLQQQHHHQQQQQQQQQQQSNDEQLQRSPRFSSSNLSAAHNTTPSPRHELVHTPNHNLTAANTNPTTSSQNSSTPKLPTDRDDHHHALPHQLQQQQQQQQQRPNDTHTPRVMGSITCLPPSALNAVAAAAAAQQQQQQQQQHHHQSTDKLLASPAASAMEQRKDFDVTKVNSKSLPLHCVVESVHSLQASLTIDQRSPWKRRPNVETDSYVIIAAATPWSEIVQTALQRLGYSQETSSTARGSLIIKNWKPIPLENISDNPVVPVSDIIGELTSVVTLRIVILRCKPSPFGEIKDKLLKLLVLQSHAVLRSTGCPLDEVTLSQICRSSYQNPFAFPGGDIPEELRRKFDQWWSNQLTPQSNMGPKLLPFMNAPPTGVNNDMEHNMGTAALAAAAAAAAAAQAGLHAASTVGTNVASSISASRESLLLNDSGSHHSGAVLPGATGSHHANMMVHPAMHASMHHHANLAAHSQFSNQKTRMRTSFDPEMELPRLQKWFQENPHPSRQQIQAYVVQLNALESRRGRKPLDVNNVVYWFKNARAAQKRAEMRGGFGAMHVAMNGYMGQHQQLGQTSGGSSTGSIGSQQQMIGSSMGNLSLSNDFMKSPLSLKSEDIDTMSQHSDDMDEDNSRPNSPQLPLSLTIHERHQTTPEMDNKDSNNDVHNKSSLMDENSSEEKSAALNESQNERNLSHSFEDRDKFSQDNKNKNNDEGDSTENNTNEEAQQQQQQSLQENETNNNSSNSLNNNQAANDLTQSLSRPSSPKNASSKEDDEDLDMDDDDDENDTSHLEDFRSPSPDMNNPMVAQRKDLPFPMVPNSMFQQSFMYMSHYMPGFGQAAAAAAHPHAAAAAHHAAAAAAAAGMQPNPLMGGGGLNLSSISNEERRKRNRTFIDPVTEVPKLEQWFAMNTHPSHSLILKYTEDLNTMPYRQKFPRLESKNVQFWFKNRRAKCKRLKMSLYDTNQCSQLTGLNSFVHKYDERD